jgi:hypothetical protein
VLEAEAEGEGEGEGEANADADAEAEAEGDAEAEAEAGVIDEPTVVLAVDDAPSTAAAAAITYTNYPTYEQRHHRSLAPDSSELLFLSGDIRCFLMAETPIR